MNHIEEKRHNPLLTVIVPVYNAEKTLHRCVDSILAQTFENFELILVDDGSKDESGRICDEYAAKNSHVRAIHKANGGASSARNAGIKIANGKYITFADSDDYVSPKWAKTFIDNIADADLGIQGINFISNNGLNEPRTAGNIYGNNIYELLSTLHNNNFLGYSFSKLFKLSIIQQYNIHFNNNIHFREDDVFILQYIEHIKTYASTNECHYNYFVPSGEKKYQSSATDCAEMIGKSLLKIFNDNIPAEICKYHFWTIKGFAITKLLNNSSISPSFIEIYHKFTQNIPNLALKDKALNVIILNSKKSRIVSSFIIKLIHHFTG